jgi:hypothetical protein
MQEAQAPEGVIYAANASRICSRPVKRMIRTPDGQSEKRKDRMNSGTGLRVLTAAILIPLVIAAIWWGPTWLIAIVSAFVAIAAMLEFFSIAARLEFQAYRLWTCLAAAAIIGQQLYASRMASINHLGDLLDRSPRITL